ncbi:MAG: hypothetical protein GY950_02870 [bacterium]|nr:hypothetical protein [bacterium]
MKAATLADVIRNFNHQKPLNPKDEEEWKSLYIDTGRRKIDKIKSDFLNAHAGYKALFGGHKGNGKSTELNKFINDPAILKRFDIISLDVNETLNSYDLEIVEFLLAICFEVLSYAAGKAVEPSGLLKKQFQKMEDYFRGKLKIEDIRSDAKGGEIGIEAEAGGGLSLPFLKLKSVFAAKMRSETESRHIIRREYRPRLNELVQLVKDLMADVKGKVKGKEPLLVIDGMDRASVQSTEKLFTEDGESLALVDNVTMLLTVPISLIHSVKSAVVVNTVGKMHVLENIRLQNIDKKRDKTTANNWELMKQAVLRRMEPELISSDALEMAIHYSGGVLRTLLDLIASAAVEADVLEETVIGKRDMEEAVKEARINKARPLGRSHWEILLDVDNHKKFIGEMDETRLELLDSLFTLEYINGDEWYSVNPLLESRLDEYRQLYINTR